MWRMRVSGYGIFFFACKWEHLQLGEPQIIITTFDLGSIDRMGGELRNGWLLLGRVSLVTLLSLAACSPCLCVRLFFSSSMA